MTGPSAIEELLAAEEIDVQRLESAFAEQARALADAGADGLVVETMADIVEAEIAPYRRRGGLRRWLLRDESAVHRGALSPPRRALSMGMRTT